MDQLFAPWRIDWVRRESRDSDDECVFCELPARDADREELIAARGEDGYVILNNYPYNPGHALVVPHRHTARLQDFSSAELLGQGTLIQRTLDALETALEPHGFNTGMNLGSAGGGSIAHVHTHVVPRWHGDTNFMATVDDTKVIVQALSDTYEEVHAAFAEQDGTWVVDGDTAVRLESD